MLIVTRDENNSIIRYSMSGVIDEMLNLQELFEPIPDQFELACANVKRINSVGIKLWREFFNKLRQNGTKAMFSEISPPLVSTLNYISDFILEDEIVSICVPVHCESCKTASNLIYLKDQLPAFKVRFPPAPCPNCGQPAEIDEVESDYFAFLP